jgi:Uncharacterised nucleotidyltransferase
MRFPLFGEHCYNGKMQVARTVLQCVRALFQRGEWPFIDEPLARALDAHGLSALVHAAQPEEMSEEARRLLRKAWMTNAARSQQEALRRALSALEGISVVAWKGVDVAARFYADPAERPMGDHDLLVRERDFDTALSKLHAIGYRSALEQTGVAAHPGHYAAQLVFKGHALDLHRSVRQTVRASIDYNAVFARAETTVIMGASVLTLEKTDRILFHAAHIAGHELHVPLIAFVDLERMLEETPVSPSLWHRAQTYALHRALTAVLGARARIFGWPHRDSLQPSANAIATQRRPPRALQLLRKFALLDDAPHRLAFLRHAVEALLTRHAPELAQPRNPPP